MKTLIEQYGGSSHQATTVLTLLKHASYVSEDLV
jgi:hypothetical protein